MILLSEYIASIKRTFPELLHEPPWLVTESISQLIRAKLATLSDEFVIREDVAIHKSARIEGNTVFKAPLIISSGCFVGAHAYIRGGVFLDENVSIGPGCEIKSSMTFSGSALAHFNFVGDSLLGSHVNMEAGAVIANHYNERKEKRIEVIVNGNRIATGIEKFGALVGDHSKIGANAVLSPGTILPPGSIVKRLALVEQR